MQSRLGAGSALRERIWRRRFSWRQPRIAQREACYLAQQAAEKALKALLIFLTVDFPRTHDLDRLCSLLPPDVATRRDHADLSWLTGWVVEARYPGDWPEATTQDARMAVEQAAAVLAAMRQDLADRGFSGADGG
jgi:HEPN domain-containing protein